MPEEEAWDSDAADWFEAAGEVLGDWAWEMLEP